MYQTKGIYKNAKVRIYLLYACLSSSVIHSRETDFPFDPSWQVAYCIHNIAYQGRHSFADFSLLNLPNKFKSSFDFTDGYDTIICSKITYNMFVVY